MGYWPGNVEYMCSDDIVKWLSISHAVWVCTRGGLISKANDQNTRLIGICVYKCVYWIISLLRNLKRYYLRIMTALMCILWRRVLLYLPRLSFDVLFTLVNWTLGNLGYGCVVDFISVFKAIFASIFNSPNIILLDADVDPVIYHHSVCFTLL